MAKRRMTDEELSWATLTRQMLLKRKRISPVAAVEKLCGMQAQMPRPPHLGLWTRVQNYCPTKITDLLHQKELVRAPFYRGTLHLVSIRDFELFHSTIKGVLTQSMSSILGKGVADLDFGPLMVRARAALRKNPCGFPELVQLLSGEFSEIDARTIRVSVRTTLPLMQVPDSSTWGYPGKPIFALAESWLGIRLKQEDRIGDLFCRYLESFGPASLADFRTWSGLHDVGEIVAQLGNQISELCHVDGRQLYDLPNSPRPKKRPEMPVRFLPDYDNLILAYQDRRRFMTDETRPHLCSKNLRILPTVLVGGRVAATWQLDLKKKSSKMTFSPFVRLTKKQIAEVEAEGKQLATFVGQGQGEGGDDCQMIWNSVSS